MSMIARKLPQGVDASDPWPYSQMPGREYTTGPWKLGIDRGGSVVLWPMHERFPDDIGVIEFAGGEKEELERFQTVFCSLGYHQESRYKYQGGAMYGFNWVSLTLATVHVASQVAERFLSGDPGGRDQAWAIGRAFGDQIETAQNEAHEKGLL